MSQIEATPLEAAILRKMYELYGAIGFPAAGAISVAARQSTPCGRYIHLLCTRGAINLEDGHYSMGGTFIEVPHVPNGMMAVALVEGGVPVQLEIVAYGGAAWSGSELGWCFIPQDGSILL